MAEHYLDRTSETQSAPTFDSVWQEVARENSGFGKGLEAEAKLIKGAISNIIPGIKEAAQHAIENPLSTGVKLAGMVALGYGLGMVSRASILHTAVRGAFAYALLADGARPIIRSTSFVWDNRNDMALQYEQKQLGRGLGHFAFDLGLTLPAVGFGVKLARTPKLGVGTFGETGGTSMRAGDLGSGGGTGVRVDVPISPNPPVADARVAPAVRAGDATFNPASTPPNAARPLHEAILELAKAIKRPLPVTGTAAEVRTPDVVPPPAAEVKTPDVVPPPAAEVKAPDVVPPPAAEVRAPDVVLPPAAEVKTPDVVLPPAAEVRTPDVVQPPATEVRTPEVVPPPAAEVRTPDVVQPPATEVRTPEFVPPPAAEVRTPDFVQPPAAEVRTPDVVPPPEAEVRTPDFVPPPEAEVRTPDIGQPPEAEVRTPDVVPPPAAEVRTPDVVPPPPAEVRGPDVVSLPDTPQEVDIVIRPLGETARPVERPAELTAEPLQQPSVPVEPADRVDTGPGEYQAVAPEPPQVIEQATAGGQNGGDAAIETGAKPERITNNSGGPKKPRNHQRSTPQELEDDDPYAGLDASTRRAIVEDEASFRQNKGRKPKRDRGSRHRGGRGGWDDE